MPLANVKIADTFNHFYNKLSIKHDSNVENISTDL